MGRYFLIILLSFLLVSCSQSDFQNCAVYSDNLQAIHDLGVALQGETFLTLYPIIWCVIFVRKLLA